ncbi:C-type lectin domain-containing protein [Caenorhabditis elegans]|uniref:C-type lectin domain-containing protein n=1 Tax=Caenorhabditis elegans TaxID=6239 RepID=O44911_CAEEL|nr:C-type lectin domain-containing protein [Caenorhabditis elegans]CCD73673.1 C-type lectin domain-containing protein [Caenorhabditis elegans]|eukprot:NP_494585.1 C-type LECtin [Caenorhabditis elegans]
MLSKTAPLLLLLLASCVALCSADCTVAYKSILNAQLTESLANGCEPGWKFFNRPSGGWCMKVINEYKGAKAEAEKECKAVGSTLSGIQNKAEASYIQSALLAQLPASVNSGSLWVGIQRVKKCLAQKLSATCSARTAFQYTDGSVTGTDGFVFQKGQPDNMYGKQNCAIFLASRTPTIVSGSFFAGTLDDTGCEGRIKNENPRVMRGYICGKKAAK